MAADCRIGMTNLAWTVGDVTIKRVEERVTALDSDILIPGITPDLLAANAPWINPYFADNGKILLSIHSFVVTTKTLTIVVDTCVGVEPGRHLPGDGEFPERLGASINGGLDGVDVVLCTHLHFDHVGWNTRLVGGQRVPTFANARYLVSSVEMAHFATEAETDHGLAAVQPLLDANLVDTVPNDYQITDEVRLVSTPGHSPGHVSVAINSQGNRALITGDATHNPIQFAYPELAASGFDWDSEASTATRRSIVSQYAETGVLILGTHFAPPTGGYLRSDGHGKNWFDS